MFQRLEGIRTHDTENMKISAAPDESLIYAPNGAISAAHLRKLDMRSTINLDDNLVERAKSLTGTKETAALVRQALETLVRVESGKRLIALGGSMPEAEASPRRRSDVAK